MSQFHLAENITQLRRNKGITQEKLADFLGISKASVSKWETGQSLPDIAQLPRLAAFYDVTIDELMGYEPQLTMAEIKVYYGKFAEEFVTNGFEETLLKVKDFIRMYYSCDMAVLQMIILLMNHLTMVEDTKRAELLEEMIELCKRIEEHSEDSNLRSNAVVFQASLELMRGNAPETIAKLEHRKNPFYMMEGADSLLIQAYRAAGQMEEATEWNQVTMYRNLLDLIQGSILYLMNHIQDVERMKSTVERLEVLMQVYEVKELNPNTYLQFVYIKAMYHMICEEQELALSELQKFVMGAIDFLTGDIRLKGDAYFDKLDGYFEKMDEYLMLPRNPQMVLSTLAQDLSNPVFAPLFDNPEYQKLLTLLK